MFWNRRVAGWKHSRIWGWSNYSLHLCVNEFSPSLTLHQHRSRYVLQVMRHLIHNSSSVPLVFYSILSACHPATICFFQIGDRVMAFVNYNAWAEVVCTPVEFVYKLPDEMTFAEAAAFALNFVAAYMMLFEVANLRAGMSVLVHSAGGGVVSQLFSWPSHSHKKSLGI